MGWFLIKRKPKPKPKRRTSRSRSSSSSSSWDPQRTLLGLKVVGIAAAVVGAGLGWHVGRQELLAYTTTHHRQRVSPERVELVNAPAWMTPESRIALQTIVADEVSDDPLDGRSLQRAALKLSDDPRVRQVTQVRRAGKRVQVEAGYRTPAALVWSRAGYLVASRDGVLLMSEPYSDDMVEQVGLPTVYGVDAPPLPGEHWAGDELPAALALIDLLRDEPFFDRVRSVSVTPRDIEGLELGIGTTTGGVVMWGLPPGSDSVAEPSAREKLRILRRRHQEPGGIDGGGRLGKIYLPGEPSAAIAR